MKLNSGGLHRFRALQPGTWRQRLHEYGHHLAAAHFGRHDNVGSSGVSGGHELLNHGRAGHAVRRLAHREPGRDGAVWQHRRGVARDSSRERMEGAGVTLRRAFLVVALSAFGASVMNTETAEAHDYKPDRPPVPIVIGHRGASGYVPEHTLTSYFIAIQDGADYVEPDLVMTQDGVLVARHENEIGGTTNVADHPEFADRKTTKVIDGVALTGWFTEDFTLAELKTLRAKERIAQLRPGNARFDGQFEVPSFEEVLGLVQAVEKQREDAAGRLGKPAPKRIGVYPETKHPTYFRGINLGMEGPVVGTLKKYGYHGRGAPIFIQSFEVQNLKDLSRVTDIRLIQLLSATGAPYDFVASGSKRTYADLITPAGLKDVASYAYGIGPEKGMVIPRLADGRLGTPTALVQNAHQAGLKVHAYTFRVENNFLPLEFRSSPDPTGLGDLVDEITVFLGARLDGFFTDNPDLGVKARDAFVKPLAE